MKKNMKKLTVLLMSMVLMVAMLAGCGTTDTGDSSNGSETQNASADNSDYKVAILLPSSISDVSWSGPAYDGLNQFAEETGVTLSYTENVEASDYESVLRGYASQGYDCIFAHGSQFTDAATLVAADYPDIQFVVIMASEGNGTNLSGVLMNNYDMGFLAGCLTGLMTENGQIASVIGQELEVLMEDAAGVKAGVAYVNPDAEVNQIVTGSSDDPSAVSEATITLLDEGCDIVTVCADAASVGAITACSDRGVLCIATSSEDFATEYPDTVPTVSVLNISGAVYNAAKMAYEGTLEPDVYTFGIAEDAVTLCDMSDAISEEIQTTMEEIVEDIKNGDLDPESYREE